MDTPPLDLVLAVTQPSTVVGESVVFHITHEVHDDVSLETVELNRTRTRVLLTSRRGADEETVALTGEDHARLYRVPALAQLGRTFAARPGQRWTTELDLFQYTRPLCAGWYRAAIEYRYGEADDEVVRSNAVDFDVLPVSVEQVTTRWFGGDGARDELASLCVAAQGARWFFRVAPRHDAGVVATEADVGAVPAARTVPSLAHLNDIAKGHFHRIVTWMEDGALGWMSVQPRGRVSHAQRIEHGLAPDPLPVCAEPALQLLDGGVAAVLSGRDAAGAPRLVLAVAAEGAPVTAKAFARGPTMPHHAAVLWGVEPGDPAGAVFYAEHAGDLWHLVRVDLRTDALETWFSTDDEVIALFVDQWLGRGHLVALTRKRSVLTVRAWNLDDEPPVAAVRGVIDLDGFSPPLDGPFSAAVLADGRGLALLFRAPDAWVVLSPEGRSDLRFDQLPTHAAVHLAANQRHRAWLLVEAHDQGPRAVQLAPAART